MITKITQNDLDLHQKWISGDDSGVRLVADTGKIAIDADLSGADLSGADLSRADLSRADLSGANLFGADLSGADLSGADLSRANLSGADLSGANLFGADLSGADLSRADLSRADLSGANLFGADLSGANLSGANLSGANLFGADLSGADLSGADLSGANLSRANLSGANLFGAKNAEYAEAVTCILPGGTLIGYKKADCTRGSVILTIEIPEGAKRSNAAGRKCRAEYARLIAIDSIGWEYDGSPVYSKHKPDFIYPAIGETVTPDRWDDDRWNECSNGVHFFITRYEAENY